MYSNFLYIKIDKTKAIYTGISFQDFISLQTSPIKNLLLIKSDYIGEHCYNKFEILEGSDEIAQLLHSKDYKYGDFCFIDYNSHSNLLQLSDNDIADLLFAAHMFRARQKPIFNCLDNRFLYLSHDDTFYCKVYYKNVFDIIDVICGKIVKSFQRQCIHVCAIPSNIKEKIACFSADGLCIDFNGIEVQNEQFRISIRGVDAVTDFDDISNQCLNNERYKKYLIYLNGEWTIE